MRFEAACKGLEVVGEFFIDVGACAGCNVNAKNVFEDLAGAVDGYEVLMGEVGCEGLYAFSVLDGSSHIVGEKGSVSLSTTGALLFPGLVFCHFDSGWGKVKELSLFGTKSFYLTEIGSTSVTACGGVSDDDVGICHLYEGFPSMSLLGSRFFVCLVSEACCFFLEPITARRFTTIRAVLG
jgi:hypothetical protein